MLMNILSHNTQVTLVNKLIILNKFISSVDSNAKTFAPLKIVNCPTLWPSEIGSHFVAVSDIYIPCSLSLQLLGSLRGSLGT